MKTPFRLALVLAALPLAAAAQDAVKVDPAHYKVLLENPSVRVLKISYAVNEKSVMHSHPDAVLVPLGTGKARFTFADGKASDNEVVKETPMYTPATTHLPSNIGMTLVDGILVEFEAKAPGKATLPTSRANARLSVLADGPYATAFELTLSPEFHEPAGSTHEYDQVVIALAASDTSLVIEGSRRSASGSAATWPSSAAASSTSRRTRRQSRSS